MRTHAPQRMRLLQITHNAVERTRLQSSGAERAKKHRMQNHSLVCCSRALLADFVHHILIAQLWQIRDARDACLTGSCEPQSPGSTTATHQLLHHESEGLHASLARRCVFPSSTAKAAAFELKASGLVSR